MKINKTVLSLEDNASIFLSNTNNCNILSDIYNDIYDIIVQLHKEGCITFLCGANSNSELGIMNTILDVKEKYPNIKLVSIIESDENEIVNVDDENSYILATKPYSRNKLILDNCEKIIFLSTKSDLLEKNKLICSFMGDNMELFIYKLEII